jgi:hypothetical protein
MTKKTMNQKTTPAPPKKQVKQNASPAAMATALSPLLANGKPVEWWFAFKFNGAIFPANQTQEPTPTLFGGQPVKYPDAFSLSYAYASSANPALQMGTGYIGTTLNDPLGATFNQVYSGNYNYVIWNDQFNGDPMENVDTPWGHSKGVLAWDNLGAGFVLQVTTPSWPGSGSAKQPRQNNGNTLGCVKDDDAMLSQHFFALKLTPNDMQVVLQGLVNAHVGTKPTLKGIFNVAGPANLKTLASSLGAEPQKPQPINQPLSSGVTFISKPSTLHVPPWQYVSAELGGLPLRVASFWTDPDKMNSTTATTPIQCWSPSLSSLKKPGAVQIATTGTWNGKSIGLEGSEDKNGNHAKIGVSMDASNPACIFGDMNQQGAVSGNDCGCSQNGRGGTFYVIQNPTLFKSLTALLKGQSAPAS